MAWDIAIIWLVAINLGLILFDSLFSLQPVSDLLQRLLPAAHGLYDQHVHQHFLLIDLAFVAVFLLDVLLGWAVAVLQKRYERWWFYPFAHWYDVLGCIPLSGFRMLRVLRIIALLVRLQRLGIIRIQDWRLYRVFKKYYDIVIEEISDRVVENVLNGLQDEVRSGGSQLPARIASEVIVPRKDALSHALARRAREVVNGTYQGNRQQISDFIGQVVQRAIENNAAVRGLDKLPWFGHNLVNAMDRGITDAIAETVDDIVGSLESEAFEELVRGIVGRVISELLEKRNVPDHEMQDVLVEILELVKQQVRVQRWKEAL